MLLQKSVVFNKQEPYPITSSSNNSTFYQNNYQQSPEHNIGHYNNSKSNYDRSQSNDFSKRSVSSKPKVVYSVEGVFSIIINNLNKLNLKLFCFRRTIS